MNASTSAPHPSPLSASRGKGAEEIAPPSSTRGDGTGAAIRLGRGEIWGGKVVGAMALALVAGSVLFLGRGAWIIAKAQLAQVLLARAWEATQAAGTASGDPAAVKPWPWADTWPVARLRVPRLEVDTIVLAGGSGEAMAFGPTLIQDGTAGDSSAAGAGDSSAAGAGYSSAAGFAGDSMMAGFAGNVVLAGHRDTHFRFLRELAEGDEIELEIAGGGTRRYRVEGSEVVDYRDRRPLAPTTGPVLTLVTCYPFDSVAPGGPLRFVVRAAAPASVAPSPPPGPGGSGR